jgi:outer membrane protein assembly factor BamA
MTVLRVLVLIFLLVPAALPVRADDAPEPAPNSAPESTEGPLPSDAALEAAHARIGHIEVHTVQIFDLSDPADDNWLFRTADHLHKNTRGSAILAQLLFRSGDPYSRRLLDETARNIRLNSSFLREPQIRPVRYHDGLVDIEVVTHDVWTFEPGINFGRSGGTNTTGADVADANFLGFGKYVEIGHGENVDRRSNFARWADPNVWGSHWVDGGVYSNNSDGTVFGLGGGLPFYSLEAKRAAGIDMGDNHSIITRYRLGQAYDAYDYNDRTANLFVGRALSITDQWTQRLLLGWRMDRAQFSAPPDQTPLAPVPVDRNLSYPLVRMQWVENHFDTIRDLDLIARTEDVHFGLDASVGLGWATPEFGSDRHSVLADTELNYGWRFNESDEMFVTARLATRFEGGALHDAMATWGAAYYVSTSDRTRLLVRFTGDAGHDLDGDHTLQLGGDTGLRGYPLRYQNGNQRALLTVEERLYTHWYLFRLFNIGGAAFYDMGRTWGTTLVPTPQLGLLKDAGVGLRLGNARSSFGSVIHIDLAAPFDRSSQVRIDSVQFLISTEQSF